MKKNQVAPIVDRAHSIWASENDDNRPRIEGKIHLNSHLKLLAVNLNSEVKRTQR